MLQSMRDGAGKWIIWIVIIVVVAALTLWGISYYFIGGSSATPPVAKVNGVKITQAEFSAAYNRLRQAQPKLFTRPGASEKIKQQILQDIIARMVLSQAASRAGFAISNAQLNAVLTQIPAFQLNGKFSQAQFSMVLNRTLFTPEQFMQNIHSALLINQVRSGIAASAFALPNEVNTYIALLKQKRDIGYLIIPSARFVRQINPTPQQVQTFYTTHKVDFKTPEKISIAYLEISPKMLAASIKPTEVELKQYYQDNLSNYTTPARWHVAHILLNIPKNATPQQIDALKARLTKIRGQVEKGESFAKLAKEHSEDVLSANKGGEIPWFSAGALGPVFERTVTQLKAGQISLPVQTRYGVELIKLLATQPQKIKTFSQVKAQLSKTYINSQVANILPKKNDALANVTFENPDSLQPAAKQLGLVVKTTPLVTRSGLKTGVTANPNIIATAFSNNVLGQGNNSDVITLADGSLIVLRVQKHVPAATKPLSMVTSMIKQQLRQQQAEKRAEQLGNTLLPEIKSHAMASAVALKHGLQWVKKVDVTRMSKGINPLILRQAFNMAAPANSKALMIKGVALANGDYALVSVSRTKLANAKSIAAAQRALSAGQLQNIFAEAVYNADVKTQNEQAKIKHYAENIR